MDSKNKKIIIGIISVLLILVMIIVIYFIAKNNKNSQKQEQKQENTVVEEVEDNEIIEETIENEEQENTDDEETNTTIENQTNQEDIEIQEDPEQPQNQIIGREEQESINQNQGPTDEEKVIELVRNKWGANDDTVSFNIANHNGDNYMVSVNSKETTAVMAWYQVNLSTGEVTQ